MARDSKDKDKEAVDPEALHRQIIPTLVGETADMFAWLERLFDIAPKDGEKPGDPKRNPDSFPERVVVCPVYGKGGVDKGLDLDFKNWKPMLSPIPTREALVTITNDFYRAAKNHCSVNRPTGPIRSARYALFAYNSVKGSNAYAAHYFVVTPGPREYREGDMPSTDDEDTHKDRLLAQSLADKRWMMEHYTESMSGLIKAQQEDRQMLRDIVKDLSAQNVQLYAERRQMIIASEEALSKKAERENMQKWMDVKIAVVGDLLASIKPYLPALAAHVTKGKAGVIEGLHAFLGGLSPEQNKALFGGPGEPGLLDEDQAQLILGIADRKIDQARLPEFVMGLRPEQMQTVQEQGILRPDQLQSLGVLVKLASAPAQNGANA
jgi:hypothetical protein